METKMTIHLAAELLILLTPLLSMTTKISNPKSGQGIKNIMVLNKAKTMNIKKALLSLLFMAVAAVQLQAAVGHGFLCVSKMNNRTDSLVVHGTYDITHSKYDIYGVEHADYVTLVVTTADGERRYPISEVKEVLLPEMEEWEKLTLTGDINLLKGGSNSRRIIFNGTFPRKNNSQIVFKWELRDSIYVHLGNQDFAYKTGMDHMTADSTRALFKEVYVQKKEDPVYVYYPGQDAPDYNHVKIARRQRQLKVDNSDHIGHSGDCATSLATLSPAPDLTDNNDNIYTFDLEHHPAFFAFLTHNPRVPSVKLKSVTLIANKPIAGTYYFDQHGIDLNSVQNPNDTITLETPFFYDPGWKHTPRIYENCQDSTAAYMVVAPQKDVDLKFIFNVEDTLSLIDTTYVKKFHIAELKANTFYTFNAEIPDTLFSIVDLGLGDIKYAFRNVEAYFERGPVSFYGGAFGYGESNTKNDYDPGYQNDNMRWGFIDKEFTPKYDAAYQRWGGCWRMQQTFEADSLLKRCKFEWREYNGTEGVLVTGPSKKRIFLPASDNYSHYWSVNREYTTDDLYYYIPGGGGALGYYKIPGLGLDKDRSVPLFENKTEFYQGGFARGILEYSNYLKSNTPYDGSLMLLRHKYEEEVAGTDRFAIVGMVRAARPWPSENTSVQLNETGFIFGTDSLTLYFDENDEAKNKIWNETDSVFENTDWRPVDGNHLMLVDGSKSVGAYAAGERDIRVELKGTFLGFLDKQKKYYVREYFKIYNDSTKKLDIYYASKATQLKGFFPHTGNIRWQVGDETATLNGYIVGISTDVVGKVGFVVSDSLKNENEYSMPTLHNREIWLADNEGKTAVGEVKNDMTFSYTIPKDKLKNDRYYFVRAVFMTENEENGVRDTTCLYAPEVKILHPLDTVDFQMSTKMANLNVGSQYPEQRDSTYTWNTKAVPSIITDIAGTEYDVVFNKWFGREGWCFTLPTVEQAQAFIDTLTFVTPNNKPRFSLNVKRVTGINDVKEYMPYTPGYNYDYANYWTSQRPTSGGNAYYVNYLSGISQSNYDNKLWVRPVLQTNCQTRDKEILFISTDTVGRYYVSLDSTDIRFYGRELGVTKAMKDKYATITRGFVLHDFKGGTLLDLPCGNMPDTVKKADIYNGLYTVPLPKAVRDTMRADKEYWYRAYITLDDQTFYGKPKKIAPLTIDIDSIGWEVHEKKATLYSFVEGVEFVNDRENAQVGYVVGDSANIDIGNYETIWYHNMTGKKLDNTRIIDGVKSPRYEAVMDVPIDTVYWVRAFVYADGVYRYSEARQFGLDYVDLGVKDSKGQTLLWANIDVGSAYAEDNPDYYAYGEAETKFAYHEKTYIDDTLKYVRETYRDGDVDKYIDHPTTSKTKWVNLTVPSVHGKDYTVRFRGAEHNKYNCEGELYWKAFAGTKNDAAYVNWGNDNPKFTDTGKYIENTKYGNLFVVPEQDEWQSLKDQCTWKFETLFGVPGWRVTGTNGNSIFLPLKGKKGGSDHIKDHVLTWTTDTTQYHSAGFFHVSDGFESTDSVKTVSLNGSQQQFFDTPSSYDDWTLTWDEFYQGHTVRPVARYNLRLSKGADKLRDDTLAYLATDTCYYLNYRTAVALQGSYRINYPLASDKYELGFVVGESEDVTWNNAIIKNVQTHKNNSQYFLVLDKNDNLTSDGTYYYRFYLKVGNSYYYGDARSFHLADQVTGKETVWKMYGTNAHITGTIQGILANEASSANFRAGLIIGYNRDLTTSDDPQKPAGNNLIDDYVLTNVLNDYDGSKGGPIEHDFTLPKDTTYYFRAYAYYNNRFHYGDVNTFGFELLDLGLPSGKRWASINTGGNSPLNGYSTWPTRDDHGVNGQTNMPYGNDGNGSAGLNDTSHKKWHNVYRQPYHSEAQELIDNCTWEPDTLYGCAGMTGTGPNGKKIFIRRNIQYYQHQDNYTDLSLNYDFIRIDSYSTKPGFSSVYNHGHGCRGVDFERAIWESTDTLPNAGKDEIVIRTDDAIVHPKVDYVSFFGSFFGAVQQRWAHTEYNVPDIQGTGFVVGSDTLTTHQGGTGGQYFKYDFPHEDVKKDSLFWYDRQNINLFKVDSTYWVRAYVKIADKYYYGRSIKFVRQPNIITGDVDWMVGAQEATVYGSVTGFNNDYAVNSGDDEELKDMEQLSKEARVGIMVGYHHDPVAADTLTNEAKLYYVQVDGHPQAVNGSFQLTVPYERDTTYYYRAFIKYNGEFVYGKTGRYGLEFRDLGFNNKMYWASINVGSRYAEDNSNQYAWGENDTRSTFRFDDYIYYYATGDDEYNNLGNEIKGTKYDVAHSKWNYTWDETEYGGRGALWSMSSEDDLQMLVDSCEWRDSISYKYVPNDNGGYYTNVAGYKVVSKKNGNWIFITKNDRMPKWTMSGYHSSYYGPWENTALWTSSRAPRDRNALGMEGGTTNRLMKYHYRYHGHYVRPIAKINVVLPDGHKMSLTTERTSWVAGVTSADIYGCILGLNDSHSATYGFVVGTTAENLKAKDDGGASDVVTYNSATNSKVNGMFKANISPLDNNRMYYYRAFAKVGNKYYYGDIKDFGIVMVDLGLTSGTKWANVNMGAWRIKDHGDFYGWGETTTKDVFTEAGYKYFDSELQHYRDLSSNISANDTTDVANKFLKGLWRMAGDEEWNELRQQCTWTRDTVAHIPGYRVKSNVNSNSIFLPSNYYTVDERDANYDYSTNEEGGQNQNHDDEVTKLGYYWSSNRSANYRQAREFNFDVSANSADPSIADNARWRGNAIRPVARPFVDGVTFYFRTESTDWRYQKDSVNFYSAVLNLPANYETGFVIGTTPELTVTTSGVEIIKARPTKDGSGNYVGTIEHNTRNDGTYYYRAYIKSDTGTYWHADSKQFGFTDVDLGVGIQWANINVDAATPEEMGLNGALTGKYAGADPAYVEFGGVWRMPTEAEKQQLLDNCSWTQETIYGVKVWKVTNNTDDSKFIYLTSNDPTDWGYRGVMESNVTFDDENKVYLRTDSTNWRAGYSNSDLFATLVGAETVLNDLQERGFVIGTSEDVKVDENMTDSIHSSKYSSSAFQGKLKTLPVGTYYYRAYVKYGDNYYYAPNALQMGIDFVDLGLPSGVKWANVNIGSTIASDTGDHYAWGETAEKDSYTYDNYAHHTSTGYTDIGADISSNATYDVATLKIEGTRLPSETEVQELISNCTWTKETLNGVDGYRVTGGGNSIFLPADYYWSSTQGAAISNAQRLNVLPTETAGSYFVGAAERYLGHMVRPVSSMIATTSPTDITTTSAQLNGIVNISDFSDVTEVGFEWSRSSAMANAAKVTVEVSTSGAYHTTISDLTEGNMYYYRAYVIKSNGNTSVTYRGAIKAFSTKSTEGTTPMAINLGLSVKWADRNVGAKLPEIDGDYYAWGDLDTQLNYTAVTYRHATGNNDNATYHYIGSNISATEWDISNRKFNGCWRMPTLAEIEELMSNCTWTWKSKEDVPGYWVENAVTHENIFLPAAGYRDNTDLNGYRSSGRYWSSIPQGNGMTRYASSLMFDATSKSSPLFTRYDGLTIRPVYDTNGKLGDQDIFIRTDSVNYAADRTSNTLYGMMLGLNSAEDNLTQGFVIGTSQSIVRTSDNATEDPKAFIDVSQLAEANGVYHITLTNDQLKTLTVGDDYWVRAYVSNGTETKYGNAIPMTDYTFFTDSVKWGLGNAATFYGHTKAQKPASGLEVGFIYSTKSDMSDSKSVVAEFDATDSVFYAQIDTVKVATYYYQAYTRYEGEVHKGAIKSFGAKAVNLGLPSGVWWVDMNMGSNDEEAVGDGYRWGEVAPNQTGSYSVPSTYNYIGGTTSDAAHTRLGIHYRLPSIANIDELLTKCTWAFDVNGYRVTGPNGNSIFIPVGNYWSSQKGEGDTTNATSLSADSTNTKTKLLTARDALLHLRAIYNPTGVTMDSDGGNAGTGDNGGGDVEGNE